MSKRDAVAERMDEFVRGQLEQARTQRDRAASELAAAERSCERLSDRLARLEDEVAGWEQRAKGDG
jgi:chromosome segregation ATPase